MPTRATTRTALFTAAVALAAVSAAHAEATISSVNQSVEMSVSLLDQGDVFSDHDSFDFATSEPIDLAIDETITASLQGGEISAHGTLNTTFSPTLLAGDSSIMFEYGPFPSNIEGLQSNIIEVSFQITVDEPTDFAYDLTLAPLAFYFSDLGIFANDGNHIVQLGKQTGLTHASGTGTFVPGVEYTFIAIHDTTGTWWDYLDNIDQHESVGAAFSYQITIPTPTTAAPLLAALAFTASRRRR